MVTLCRTVVQHRSQGINSDVLLLSWGFPRRRVRWFACGCARSSGGSRSHQHSQDPMAGSIVTSIPSVASLLLHPSPSFFQQPLAMTNPFSVSKPLSFEKCYINGIVQLATFWGWLYSRSIISWRLTQVVERISSLFLFYLFTFFCRVVFHGTYVPLFV